MRYNMFKEILAIITSTLGMMLMYMGFETGNLIASFIGGMCWGIFVILIFEK